MLMYRVDSEKTSPVPVECPKPCYPHDDADGEPIYENTHFASIADAWARLQSEADAGVSLSCSNVNEARRRLAEAEKILVDDTLQAEAVRQARKGTERSPECHA